MTATTEPTYEYCVMHPDHPDEPHRGPWPQEECWEWIGYDGLFYVARRAVGPWERV